jgi:transforming growth factor-beta-induced protein
VEGFVLSTDLVNGDVETLNGDTVMIKVSGNGIMVNNANIIAADIIACNGVIHVINKVLLPPS